MVGHMTRGPLIDQERTAETLPAYGAKGLRLLATSLNSIPTRLASDRDAAGRVG